MVQRRYFIAENIFNRHRSMDSTSDNFGRSTSPIISFPREFASLNKCRRGLLHADHRIGKVVYSRSSTHVGNRLIVYYLQKDANSLPVYGSIEYIFSINGDVKFAARHHKPASVSLDRFALTPTSLRSSTLLIDPTWRLSR